MTADFEKIYGNNFKQSPRQAYLSPEFEKILNDVNKKLDSLEEIFNSENKNKKSSCDFYSLEFLPNSSSAFKQKCIFYYAKCRLDRSNPFGNQPSK